MALATVTSVDALRISTRISHTFCPAVSCCTYHSRDEDSASHDPVVPEVNAPVLTVTRASYPDELPATSQVSSVE